MDAIRQAGEARSARVESLRALAALGVLAGHAFGEVNHYDPAATLSTFPERALTGGGFGVFLFFALSGYLLFLPFARRDYGDGRRVDLRRYAANRALRILPLYFVVIAVVLLVGERGGTPEQWLRFATFTETLTTDRTVVTDVNGVVWSLVVELHFYLVLPFAALAIAKLTRGSLRRAALVLAALGLASVAFRYATFYRHERLERPLPDWSLVSTFFFFVSGMLVALARVAWERRRPGWLDGPLGRAELWLAASAALWAVVVQDYAHGWAAAPASALLVGACVLPLRGGWTLRPLDWRPLALVGVASYSVYMWHLPIVESLGDASWAPSAFVPFLVLVLAVTCAVSALSYRLVEAPFLRLRRRWGSTAALPRGPVTTGRPPAAETGAAGAAQLQPATRA
jgi:peptidoglycan/LPS O-acetylase OafA/YrhL